MEDFFYRILLEISQEAYKKSVNDFKIKISPEIRQSFHARYFLNKRLIEVYNLYRDGQFIIAALIHEFAHHIAWTRHKDSKHDKLFYQILKELLSAAVRLGYLDYGKIKEVDDARDIRMMEKYFGPVTEIYNPEKNHHKDQSVIKVRNSFSIKDQLKERGYKYNSQEKAWQKEINNSDAESEKEYIESIADQAEIDIISFSDISLTVYYYIIISGKPYELTDNLKKLGYWYGGYYQKDKWVKKVEGRNLLDEQKKLTSIGLSFQIKTKL